MAGIEGTRRGADDVHSQIKFEKVLTLARAFLQLRQALRVTDSGTLRRFDKEELLSATFSFSPRFRRGSGPVLSGVDWFGEPLLSPKFGRILRRCWPDILRGMAKPYKNVSVAKTKNTNEKAIRKLLFCGPGIWRDGVFTGEWDLGSSKAVGDKISRVRHLLSSPDEAVNG